MTQENNHKDRLIAAGITFLAVLLILLFLFKGGLNYQRAQLAEASVPELMDPDDDEELFLEPELLAEQGEPDAANQDAPAPAEQGEPEKGPENTKLVVPGDNPKPAPQIEKLNTQKQESPVKATNPPATKEEPSKVSSELANKFSGKNGTPAGKTGSNGSGGDGQGVTGTANGRVFKGCSLPDVALRHKTTVKVSVVIDADGNVIKATASGAPDANIRRACEQAARTARWSSKKGAAETYGTITFTIIPK